MLPHRSLRFCSCFNHFTMYYSYSIISIELSLGSLTSVIFMLLLFQGNLKNFKYILLIMLLQFSYFFLPFIPLLPAPLPLPFSIPPPPPAPLSSCPWVIHISSLASPFPILFLTSHCLFCTYHLCFLFPVPPPHSSPPPLH